MSRRAEIHPGSVAVFVASLVVLLSCGGGGGGGGGADGGAGSSGAPDGGAGDTSSAPDGGVSATGGGTTGGTADGGTGSSGGGGASDGGTTDGGTARNPCDALVPTFGAEIAIPRGAGTHSTCDYATSHEDGQVALSITSAGGGGISGDASFSLYTADGLREGSAIDFVSNISPHQLLDPWLHPAAAGNWQGLAHIFGGAPSQVFRTWGAAGGTLAETRREAIASAPTVDDGSVVLDFDFTPGTPPIVGPTNIEWFDGIGTLLRSVVLGEIPDMVLQAFGTRHVLTLQTTSSPWRARWYDEHGVPLTDAFPVPGTPYAGVDPWFKLLLDGRVAINDGATWAAVLPDGQAHTDPVPDWLSSRPNTRIATIRQGSGYAVMPLLFAGSSKFEILTPDGTSCGAFNTPAPSPPNGETWGPESLNVGYDGTLLEVDNAHGGDLDVSIHCVYRWWPALLK